MQMIAFSPNPTDESSGDETVERPSRDNPFNNKEKTMKLTIEFHLTHDVHFISFFKGDEEVMWEFIDDNHHRITRFAISISQSHAASCHQNYEVELAYKIDECLPRVSYWSIQYLCGAFLE